MAPSLSSEDGRCKVVTCRSLGLCDHKWLIFLSLEEASAAEGKARPLTPFEEGQLATLRVKAKR